jgi:hypothetical protein
MPAGVRGWQDRPWFGLCPTGGDPGRLILFADAAIHTYPTIKIPFAQPLRQTAGMVTGIRQCHSAILDRDARQ